MPALIAIALAFAAGILVSRQLPFNFWLISTAALVIIGIWTVGQRKRQAASVAILLLAFLAGALRLGMADLRTDELAPYTDKTVVIEGTVVSEAESTSLGSTYVLAVRLVGQDQLYPATGRVLLRDLRLEKETYGYGDLVRVRGKLVRPRGASNFGQFDYRAYLERRGIFYQLALSTPDSIQYISADQGPAILGRIFELRRRFFQVAAILPPAETALLKGLTLGERQLVSAETVNFFTASGTVHLMAVSGVHVGMVAALALGLARLLHLPFFLQSVFAGLTVLLYTAWTGFAPSAVRAGIMFTLGLLGLSTGRPRNSLVALAAAALILLTANPLNLFDTGFQLSFAAAAGILYFGSQTALSAPGWRRLGTPLIASAAAQLCTWPLTAYYFSGVSLVGFLASVVAIPVAGLALSLGLAGLLLGSIYLPVGKLILGAAGAALVVLTFLARLFACWPGAFVYVGRPPIAFLLVYYSAVFTAPYFLRSNAGRVRLRRGLFIATTLILLVVTWFGPVPEALVVDFLAVGQGDAILIRSPSGQAALIDTGPRISTDKGVWDAGDSILLPYLRAQGVHRLELVFLTHGDTDHAGGAAAIISSMPVGAVIAPATFEGTGAGFVRAELERRGVPLYTGTSGLRVDLGAHVEVMVLSPPPEPIVSNDTQNDNSLVLYLRYGQSGFLFTGDAGQPAEQYLLKQGLPGPVNVLKVAHHGAATATTEEFIQQLRPELAVISVGKNNFGHPSPATLERLLAGGALVLRTDEDGQVRVESDGQTLEVSTFAQNRGDKK